MINLFKKKDSRPTKKAKFNSSQPISIQEVSESNLNTFQKILKRNQVRLINSGKTFFGFFIFTTFLD